MADWSYKREEGGFETKVPEGKHRIRIKEAEKAVSKSGNDMLVLKFDVSGYDVTLYHYIVFMPDKPEITNRNLTQFFDSFKGIPAGQFDISKWGGQTGAAEIKHEEYNGNINAKIKYFIPADKQGDLPNWVNASGIQEDSDGFMVIPEGADSDLPF